MMRHYLCGYMLRAAADDDQGEETGPLRIVAATAGMKGDGLNLTMDGADLGRFESNPVVGYGHSYWGRDGLPTGRSDKTWIDGDKLMMDIRFDQEDEFARTVERKYRGGYMNAFSIGFDVWNIDDSGTPEGWELFEVSAVPLPKDPNAVVESGRELELARAFGGLRAGEVLRADDLARAIAELRAGAVLSKKNKTLAENAVTALQELLGSADGTEDEDDDARKAPLVDSARLLRLAGI